MEKLPQGSSENEHLLDAVSEEPIFQESFFQGNLHVRVQQNGDTNDVSWDTSRYNAYPYVTITRQDTTGPVTLLDHSWKYSLLPYPDRGVPAGDHVYTVALSNASQIIGIQGTVEVVTNPRIEPVPFFPIKEQPIEDVPVEIVRELPLTNAPSVVSEEQVQE